MHGFMNVLMSVIFLVEFTDLFRLLIKWDFVEELLDQA